MSECLCLIFHILFPHLFVAIFGWKVVLFFHLSAYQKYMWLILFCLTQRTPFLRPLSFHIPNLNHVIIFLSFILQQYVCNSLPFSFFISHSTPKGFFSLILSILSCLSLLLQLFTIFWHITPISPSFPFCQIHPISVLYNSCLKLAAQFSCYIFPIANYNITSTILLLPSVRPFTGILPLYRTPSFLLPPTHPAHVLLCRLLYVVVTAGLPCKINPCILSVFVHPPVTPSYFYPSNHSWLRDHFLYIFYNFCCHFLLWSPILLPLFQHFATGSGEQRWDSVTGKLASPTVLYYLYYPAHSSSTLNSVREVTFVFYGMRHSFNHFMHFMLLKSVCTCFIKNRLSCSYGFCGYFILSLLASQLFCMEMESDNLWMFCQSQLAMNTMTAVYGEALFKMGTFLCLFSSQVIPI